MFVYAPIQLLLLDARRCRFNLLLKIRVSAIGILEHCVFVLTTDLGIAHASTEEHVRCIRHSGREKEKNLRDLLRADDDDFSKPYDDRRQNVEKTGETLNNNDDDNDVRKTS